MDNRVTKDTLALLNDTMGGSKQAEMIKAWLQPTSATTGLQNYDLEATALSLVPVETPLFNRTPIVGASGGIQANWHAVTAINTTGMSPGLSEGNRGGVVTTATADYFAKYASFGHDDYLTEEAEWSAEDYMDLLSLGQRNLLWTTKISMEKVYLGGLGTYGLGQTPRPSVADVGTGGTLAPNTNYSVIVAALSLDGYLNASVAGGVRGLVSRTNVDGSTDQYGGGTAQLSQNRTVTTANDGNNTHALTASVATIAGAVGYAWFWGAAGAELLGAVTSINSLLITSTASGTQTAASLGAGDNSQNTLICDGLISQIAKPGMGGYIAAQATGAAGTGTPLTADGEGGIVEIDTALKYFYDNYRMSPSRIMVSSQELTNISKKIAQGPSTGTSNLRFVRDSADGQLIGAVIARAYLNRYTVGLSSGASGGQEIPIELHPNLTPGTLIFDTDKLPYPMSGVNNVKQFRARKNFYATLWPKVKRRWEYGVYLNGVFQNYFIPGFGMITNIGNG
jgi:hypothetical protein